MTTSRHALTVTRPYVLHGTIESCTPARGTHNTWPAHNLFVMLDQPSADAPQSVVFVRASEDLLRTVDLCPGAHVTIQCNLAVETHPGQRPYFDVSYLLASAIERD